MEQGRHRVAAHRIGTGHHHPLVAPQARRAQHPDDVAEAGEAPVGAEEHLGRKAAGLGDRTLPAGGFGAGVHHHRPVGRQRLHVGERRGRGAGRQQKHRQQQMVEASGH